MAAEPSLGAAGYWLQSVTGPFLFTTLVEEPASAVTLLQILLLSIDLELGWHLRRHDSDACAT